jgi:hypothetical protein
VSDTGGRLIGLARHLLLTVEPLLSGVGATDAVSAVVLGTFCEVTIRTSQLAVHKTGSRQLGCLG